MTTAPQPPGPDDGPPVVVGITPAQEPGVLRVAVDVARGLRVPLLCVWIEEAAAVLPAHVDDAETITVPVDPDSGDESDPPAVLDEAVRTAEAHGVPASAVVGAGEPAHELARVGEEAGARLIVVGARRPGLSGWMHHVVGGTVAGRLAHVQSRPVVVVPHDGAP